MKYYILPSGHYRAQVPLKDDSGHVLRDENGKRMIVSVTAPTKAEVERQACQIMGARHVIVADPVMTVREAMEKYCEDRSNILSPSTLYGYEMIRNKRLQAIMDISISGLTKEHVQSAVNQDCMHYSEKSVKEAVCHLKTVLEDNDISLNLKKISIKPTYNPVVDLPDIGDVLCSVLGSCIELPCLVSLWCSLRVSEVRGLQFRDISKDGKYITIQRVMLNVGSVDVEKNSTKTMQSTRTICLPEWLYMRISAIPHNSDTDYIFPVGYKYIYYHFNKLMKANNIEGFTFHGLRHLFATTCNVLGIDEKYIMRIGGWSTPYVMKKVYTHIVRKKEMSCHSKIDSYFESMIQGITSEDFEN